MPQHAVPATVVVLRKVDVVLVVGCKNCSGNVSAKQQHSPAELLEVEQGELLHDELLRMEYGEEVVIKEETED